MSCLTKIVATVGPACEDDKTLGSLIEKGVDVFRFNLKHGDLRWHKRTIKKLRGLAEKKKTTVSVMLDLQGPELRLETAEKKDIDVKRGEEIYIGETFLKDKKSLLLSKNDITKSIKVNQKMHIDNGLYEFVVVFSKKGLLVLKSSQDCTLINGKSVAIPGFDNDLPALTRSDFGYLSSFRKLPVDFVCLSFCRSKDDMEKLKQVLKMKKIRASVVAKIENKSALDNLTDIIKISDAVMVARGDLGVEVPLREVVYWQKEIVKQCRIHNKPVIVATQMMESMIDRPSPTRAEVSDVSNAIFDGTDSIMLSGETAIGKHPIGVVDYMIDIASFSESKRPIGKLKKTYTDIGSLVVGTIRYLVLSVSGQKIDKVLVFSKSGNTARKVSSYRLKIPIIVVTDIKKTFQDMSLSYSVVPYFKKFESDKFDMKGEVINELIKNTLLKKGDRVIVVHGQNWLVSSTTNEVGVFEV
jgi:pyruvate kinase